MRGRLLFVFTIDKVKNLHMLGARILSRVNFYELNFLASETIRELLSSY